MTLGNMPWHHHSGMRMPKSAVSRPSDVPVTRFESNRFCQMTASVHCGMM